MKQDVIPVGSERPRAWRSVIPSIFCFSPRPLAGAGESGRGAGRAPASSAQGLNSVLSFFFTATPLIVA
jgi:hypothetical protein